MNEQGKQDESGQMQSKRPYARPLLRKIDLSAEETLAAGCKMASGGNASGGFTCIANGCSSAGS